jgi:anhydro-N-acetylmuramic acid kinase
MTSEYLVVGLMSGTSLDGLDIALCHFTHKDRWSFKILKAITFDYNDEWKNILGNAHLSNALELAQHHVDLGILHAHCVNDFLRDEKVKPDFISSHGHTIFHQPEKSLTLQIGSAAHLAALTQLPVVADFRTTDVALGGQGAPLVPIGDLMLFDEYDYCLNLGGIANISEKSLDKKSIVAYDVCPCNMMLNFIAQQLGQPYDEGGKIASTGNEIPELLNALNALSFYQQAPPKSLGKEFFDAEILPLIDDNSLNKSDILFTLILHIAQQLSRSIGDGIGKKILVTGGGALNTFFIQQLKSHTVAEVIVPDDTIVQFKEALIFAFLGVLRQRNEVNCLSSVTGAKIDHSGGAVYL